MASLRAEMIAMRGMETQLKVAMPQQPSPGLAVSAVTPIRQRAASTVSVTNVESQIIPGYASWVPPPQRSPTVTANVHEERILAPVTFSPLVAALEESMGPRVAYVSAAQVTPLQPSAIAMELIETQSPFPH